MNEKAGYWYKTKLARQLAQVLPVPYFEPTISGNLYMVRHDAVPRKDPEVFKSGNDSFYPVSTSLSAYIIGLLRLLNPSMPYAEFIRQLSNLYSTNRAFSNGHPYDSSDWRIENLICGGATVRKTGFRKKIGGKWHSEVYALDPTTHFIPPKSLSEVNMEVHFFAVVSNSVGAQPFPQLGGKCVIPYLGKGGRNYLNESYLMHVGTIVQPFSPARPDITAGLIG